MFSQGAVVKWPCHAIMSVMNGIINKGRSLRRETILGFQATLWTGLKFSQISKWDISNLGRYCCTSAKTILGTLFSTSPLQITAQADTLTSNYSARCAQSKIRAVAALEAECHILRRKAWKEKKKTNDGAQTSGPRLWVRKSLCENPSWENYWKSYQICCTDRSDPLCGSFVITHHTSFRWEEAASVIDPIKRCRCVLSHVCNLNSHPFFFEKQNIKVQGINERGEVERKV